MDRFSSSSFASLFRTALTVTLALGLLPAPVRSQAIPRPATTQAPAPANVGSLLAQAVAADAELRVDAAVDRLYELLIEHPGTADAIAARPRLARLLALSGNLPQAILQCQLLRDELHADNPARGEALELATLLGRRLRAAQGGLGYFPTFEPVPARGVQSMDESREIVFEGEGRFVLLDEGAGRVYRVGAESGAILPAPQDPSAIAVMPDGVIAIAGKTGVATVPASRTVILSGSWGGKARQAKNVRSMAALSDGSLLVVDKDYDGLLKCQLASGACAPWGPAGKYRTVRVGPGDWVYLLDDRGQSVRIIDSALRSIALVGPMAGAAKLDKVEDMAVDRANGFYLLDTNLKRVFVFYIRTQPDGRLGAVPMYEAAFPVEGERAFKNASAIGVSPTGQLYVAGKSAPRMMRFR